MVAAERGPTLRRRWANPSATRWLPVVALLVPLGLVAVSSYLTWRAVQDQARVKLALGTEAVAEHAQLVLTGMAFAVDRLAWALHGVPDEEVRLREPSLHRHLQQLVADVAYTTAAFVTGAAGEILVSSARVPVPRGESAPALRGRVMRLVRSPTPEVGLQVLVDDLHPGRPSFALTRDRQGSASPHPASDGTAGLVAIILSASELAAAMRARLHDATDLALLMSADGEVLGLGADPSEAAELAKEALAALAQGAAPSTLSHWLGQRGNRVWAVQQVDGWPLYVVAGMPRSAAAAQWRDTLPWHFAVGIPAAFALFALARAAQRSVVRLSGADSTLADSLARGAKAADAQERLLAALTAGRIFSFEFDPGGDSIIRSSNAAAILGLSTDEGARQPASRFLAAVDPEDRGRVLAAIANATPDRPHYAAAFRYRRPDGGTVWLSDFGRAEFHADGQVARITGLSRDVTAATGAVAAWREAEMRLRTATEGAGLGVYEVDLERNAAWFDARAAEAVGAMLPAGAWIPLDGPEWAAMVAAIHPDDREAFDAAWRRAVSGEAAGWTLQTRIRRPDGRWAWDWSHGSVVARDERTGHPLRIVGITWDDTDRKRLESELRQAQKLQVLGELAGGIAHDFNNVLQVVASLAATLEREADQPDSVMMRVKRISEAVARGAAVTHRLLEFARRTEPRRDVLCPQELLVNLRAMLDPTTGPNIEVRIEAADDLPDIVADRAQLQTALLNLATNACDAMPHGGVLTLAASLEHVTEDHAPLPHLAAGQYVRIAVRDSGSGMDVATLKKIGEPFFTTKPAGKGTGLGLSMAKRFSEQSGGGLAIESEPGRGTTVKLWLPLAQAAASDAGPHDRGDATGAAAVSQDRRVWHLLLVDDDAEVREALAEELRTVACSVVTAADAAEALAIIDAGQPLDALVTDLVMPGPDGLALIAEARQRRPGLTCLLVTGSQVAQEELLARAPEAAGALRMMRKPLAGTAVAELVKAT